MERIKLFSGAEEPLSGKSSELRFSTALFFALAGHFSLLAVLLLVPPSASTSPSSELKTVRRALSEIARETGAPGISSAPGAPSTGAESVELARTLGGSIRFSDEANIKEKVEIVKAMIRSFARTGSEREGSDLDLKKFSLDEIQTKIEEGSIRLPGGEKVFASKSAGIRHELEIHTLSRDDELQISRLARKRTEFSGLEGERYIDSFKRDLIPEEIFYRKCPYEEILAWGPSLFTVVGGFPDFAAPSAVKMVAAPPPRKAPEHRSAAGPSLSVFIVSGGNPSPIEGGTDSPNSAERFRPAGMARTLDEWMAKPEREQWLDFKRDYLDRFDPDSPELAEFTRLFISSNVNGIFYTLDVFAEAFDCLEELYYKRPIYDAFPAYGRSRPATKTAAEILFSLAAAYDFERRTLALIEEIGPLAVEITENGVPEPGAYDFQVKAYVLKKMFENMRVVLTKDGRVRFDRALKKYREASLDIYRHLAESGGDIGDRALLAIGITHWEDGNIAQAFSSWRDIRPSFDSPVYRFIKPYLEFRDGNLSVAHEEIRRFFAARIGDENGNHLHRHLRFHKWRNRSAARAVAKN